MLSLLGKVVIQLLKVFEQIEKLYYKKDRERHKKLNLIFYAILILALLFSFLIGLNLAPFLMG